MERFSTMVVLEMQATIVTLMFDKIYLSMFNTLNPIRETALTGIQLTENVIPKPEKKKKEQQRGVQEPDCSAEDA